jgi:ubiquinone/menaquinone biosynthesis C-methylase UbiE
VLFANAKRLGFRTASFDIAICGFVGWYDCYDFARGEFTQPDTKTREIWRVLREGGRFVCCSWEEQEGLAWMEQAVLRHYPAILQDDEYLKRHPIGMSYEKIEGYEIIFRSAGFREVECCRETMTFVSTDEEQWWAQMLEVGWKSLITKIKDQASDQLQRVKGAILRDLQQHKQADGIHFDKVVFFCSGVK